jgi:hypothetical protein
MRKITTLTIAAAGALLVAACGQKAEEAPAADASAAAPAADASAAAPAADASAAPAADASAAPAADASAAAEPAGKEQEAGQDKKM